MNAPLLQVRGLTMRFGGLLAIDSLDLIARDRDITAIIGPNGAGKTTVFNCLTGFYRATGGRLLLNHPRRGELFLEKLPGHQVAAKAGVVRTFQNIRLFARMTLLENLLVAQHNKLMRASYYTVGGLFGLPSCRRMEKLAVDKACFWLERIKLIDKADQEAGTLPYGAQRRLEIARAMCAEPVLLCLDEPAAGLNPRESADLNELLLAIRKEQEIAILLIEHDMSVVMQISDRIYVLDHGKRIAAGTPVQIRNDPAVINAYLGEDDSAAQMETRRGEDA